jgi:hypothetical protein
MVDTVFVNQVGHVVVQSAAENSPIWRDGGFLAIVGVLISQFVLIVLSWRGRVNQDRRQKEEQQAQNKRLELQLKDERERFEKQSAAHLALTERQWTEQRAAFNDQLAATNAAKLRIQWEQDLRTLLARFAVLVPSIVGRLEAHSRKNIRVGDDDFYLLEDRELMSETAEAKQIIHTVPFLLNSHNETHRAVVNAMHDLWEALNPENRKDPDDAGRRVQDLLDTSYIILKPNWLGNK